MSTCRFCKTGPYDDDKMVKYEVRHYAHFKCYLDAGKSVHDLHDWQVLQFPYRLLKERGLADHAEKLADARSSQGGELMADREACCNCDQDCTPHFFMCDEPDAADATWCPTCFEKTACAAGVHGEGCMTSVISDGRSAA